MAQISCGFQWYGLRPPNSPDLLIDQASAYDSRRGVAVLFGGENPSTGIHWTADTWEFDGANWTKRLLFIQPPARRSAAMAYDTDRGVCVLFGGGTNIFQSEIPFNDTWEWDGITWKMLRANDPAGGGNRPPPLDYAMMSYDSVRKRMVLIGGYERTSGKIIPSGRTWEWDGVVWTVHDQLTGASPGPPARLDSAMAFDPIRRVTVVFGGTSVDRGLVNDTWVWDGVNWKQMQNMGAFTPRARDQHAMAFDSFLGLIILFGGTLGGPLAVMNDTWAWDGTSWTNLPLANQTGLSERRRHKMWYDDRVQRVMVFGGTVSHEAPGGGFDHIIYNNLYESPIPGRWVDFNFRGSTTLLGEGNFHGPFKSLSDAVNAAPPGCTINIKPGSSAETLTITKPLTLRAYSGPATIGRRFIPN